MCLPRYNAEGFLHVYVSFINGDESGQDSPPPPSDHASVADDASMTLTDTVSTITTRPPSQARVDADPASNEVCLVIVSAQKDDFEKIHSWAGNIESVSGISCLLFSTSSLIFFT